MPQYVCAVNKRHMKWGPVNDQLQCCGKPMLFKESARQQQLAAVPANPQATVPQFKKGTRGRKR